MFFVYFTFSIKAAGTKCRMAARCPGLTEDDKFQRLSWAHDHAQYNEEFWNQVVWTDETSHRSDQVNRKRVWRADGTR